MPREQANGIEIVWEGFGDPAGRPLLLIMGLASQMIGWPDRFCRMLAESGHFVVRFDNRDVGLSSKMEGGGVPDLDAVTAAAARGGNPEVPYTLGEMAGDTLGLLDALSLSSANVCGISMGGMIAQILALRRPERIRTLVCLETTSGESDLPPFAPEAASAIFSTPPEERSAYLDHMAGVYRSFSGGSPLFDENLQRSLSGAAYDRMRYPEGFVRQMAAILAAPGRRRMLRDLRVPTLVLHGDCDPVFPPAHGRDIAENAPEAALLLLNGLGHGMAYPALWPEMVAAISSHTR